MSDSSVYDRSQRWIARGVLACGATTIASLLAVPAVCNPDTLNQPQFWFLVWLVVFPFIWVSISIRNCCRTRSVVWGTRLAVLPIVGVGLQLSVLCVEIIDDHLRGPTFKSPFYGMQWGLPFLFVAYVFAFLTARIAYGPPPTPGRGIFLHLGETSDDVPRG